MKEITIVIRGENISIQGGGIGKGGNDQVAAEILAKAMEAIQNQEKSKLTRFDNELYFEPKSW